MTDPTTATEVVPSPLPLREPVRLYVYSAATLIVAGLVLAGWLTDEWSTFLTIALAQLLGVVPAAELARGSVYSPRTLSLASRRVAHRVAATSPEAARIVVDQLDPIGRYAA